MKNKLILKLIKNNIDEISRLIMHFQNEEDDLKSGFPLLDSRLNSLNKDIEILKSNLNHEPIDTNSVLDSIEPIDSNEPIIPPVQNKKPEILITEQTNNKTIYTEKESDIIEKTIHKLEPTFSTLNDKLHESGGDNLQEKIKKSKLDDIQYAIGINDQFLFIRELFESKTEAYKAAINYINSENDYNKIVSFFEESHKWDNEDLTVIQFFDLIKRKFE